MPDASPNARLKRCRPLLMKLNWFVTVYVYVNIMTSVPGVMPNQALPPAMNTATTLMMTTVMAAVMMPRVRLAHMRLLSRSTTLRLARSNSARS